MNNERILTIFTCVLLLIASGNAQDTKKQSHRPLNFTLKALSSVFTEGNDISLEFSLTNTTTRRVLATREASLHDVINLDIASIDGKRVSWSGKITSRAYPPEFFVILDPGQSVSFQAVISHASGGGYRMQKPGTYRVSALFSLSPKEYFSPVAKDAIVPDHPVRSNTVNVVVKKKPRSLGVKAPL